jgi:hypothetical protein
LSCWRYLGWSWVICARWETEESDKTRPDGRQNRQASASETSWCKRTANRAEPGVKRVSILKTPVLVSSFAAPLISTCKLSWSFRLLDIATSGVSIHSFLLHSTKTQHSTNTSCLNRSLPVSLSHQLPTFDNVPCPPGEARREFGLAVLARLHYFTRLSGVCLHQPTTPNQPHQFP